MEIQKILITKINPAAYNPRIDLKPGDEELEKLRNSIKNFGYVEPLVWNKQTGNLVSGHQRLKILVAEGIEEIEVSVVDLPLEKEKMLNLALNKIRGDWDEDKLARILEELSASAEIDISLTGFDLPEISEIIDASHETPEDDDFDFEGAVGAIKEPITKPGDVIELGPHRMICGDSSNPDHLEKLLGTTKVNLLHMDPPYNVDYYGGNRPNAQSRPAKHKLWERIYSDNMTQPQYEQWLRTVLTNATHYLAAGAPAYMWNGHRQFGPMHQMLTELDFHVSCVITWAKQTFALGYGDYNQQTEFCLYGWKKGESHFWNGPTNESTLWEIKRDLTKNYIHPTQKPIEIAARAMRNSSKRGDVVLDLFLGSGSTLIAAATMERRCFGVEIDPRYCDAIVRRYIAFVGRDKVSEELKKKYMQEVSDDSES